MTIIVTGQVRDSTVVQLFGKPYRGKRALIIALESVAELYPDTTPWEVVSITDHGIVLRHAADPVTVGTVIMVPWSTVTGIHMIDDDEQINVIGQASYRDETWGWGQNPGMIAAMAQHNAKLAAEAKQDAPGDKEDDEGADGDEGVDGDDGVVETSDGELRAAGLNSAKAEPKAKARTRRGS